MLPWLQQDKKAEIASLNSILIDSDIGPEGNYQG